MATAMTLERCAEMRAEMDAGHLRDDVLARAGVGVEAWTEAQGEWLDRMGRELEQGRFELTNRYTRTFLARQRALQAASPAGLTVESPVATPSPAPTPILRAPEVPSFLRPASAELPGPNHLPVASPTLHRAPAALSGTSLELILPKGQALPFAPAAAAPTQGALPPEVPSPPPRPTVHRAPAALSGTSLELILPKGQALPFAPAAGAPAQGALPPDPSPPLPTPNRAPGALTGTSLGFVVPKGPALPFAKSSPPPPAPPPPLAAAPDADAAAGPLVLGGFTLEQHVSLCADLAFAPSRTTETLARYRISPAAKADLDRQWNERFTADPALATRWREAYGMYLAFLGSRAQPP